MGRIQDVEKIEQMRLRIISLFDDSGEDDTELERKIGLPRSIIYDWRKKRNRSFRSYLPQIAEYFNISLNWLAGNEQKNKPSSFEDSLSPDEKKLISNLRKMDKEQRNGFMMAAGVKIDQINQEDM